MNQLIQLINEERGNAILFTALMITALFGFSALVVDAGQIFVEDQKLQNALDAAVLAGVQDIVKGQDAAREMTINYAQKNGVSQLDVYVDYSNKMVSATAMKEIPLFFAKIFGRTTFPVSAASTAQIGVISKGEGFAPLGIEKQSFQYGEMYRLKEGGGEGSNGNYGALALGGSGASNYRDNLKYGYEGELSIGMKVSTEPGNMAGPTRQALDYLLSNSDCDDFTQATRDCPRVVYVPVVDGLDEASGRDEVTIVGFAAFYLEDVENDRGRAVITGRFIQMVYPGDFSTQAGGYGLYGVKLVN
ncbi:Tad domain-containing protein [Microaerobacter geothermalis]|uniref:Tad domain-containing protein n=1 Tax=Microaerobacter geothermalis TaxID=674972 RepID=UPI001F42A713|nr:Tad domain-containing protein [Microaerobacter geothermalis]MCF6094189.1 Tad domain-containing protein [Microaerobacter geothermalis]